MMVTENGRPGRSTFTIAAKRQVGPKWEYQLRQDDGTLHGGEDAWHAERKLSFKR
jgi:hypothetical protein